MRDNGAITKKEVVPMSHFACLFAVVGACYFSYLLTRFLVWLDVADDPED